MFPTRVDDDRLRFLFASMIAANINSARVWGGGRYESDLFYQLADANGILIWQDIMFACAYYPVNAQFLDNIRQEITEQVSDYLYLFIIKPKQLLFILL